LLQSIRLVLTLPRQLPKENYCLLDVRMLKWNTDNISQCDSCLLVAVVIFRELFLHIIQLHVLLVEGNHPSPANIESHLQQLGIAYPSIYCPSHPTLIDAERMHIQQHGIKIDEPSNCTFTFVSLPRTGHPNQASPTSTPRPAPEKVWGIFCDSHQAISLAPFALHLPLSTSFRDRGPGFPPVDWVWSRGNGKMHIRHRMASSISERHPSSSSPFSQRLPSAT
jgi:hypothetical protein